MDAKSISAAAVALGAKGGGVLDVSGLTAPVSLANLKLPAKVILTGAKIMVPAGQYGVALSACSNLAIDQFTLQGVAGAAGNGASLRTCTRAELTNSTFFGLQNGLYHQANDGMLLEGNDLYDIAEDGFRGLESCDVVIRRNFFTDFARGGTQHPDYIQFWTSNAKRAAQRILIEENVMLRGAGSPCQGVFMGNEWNMAYVNVTIRGNVIIGGYPNGLSIGVANTVLIEDNTVIGYTDIASKIRVEHTAGITFNRNHTSHYVISGNTGYVTDGVAGVGPKPDTVQLLSDKAGVLVDPDAPKKLVIAAGLASVAGYRTTGEDPDMTTALEELQAKYDALAAKAAADAAAASAENASDDEKIAALTSQLAAANAALVLAKETVDDQASQIATLSSSIRGYETNLSVVNADRLDDRAAVSRAIAALNGLGINRVTADLEAALASFPAPAA